MTDQVLGVVLEVAHTLHDQRLTSTASSRTESNIHRRGRRAGGPDSPGLVGRTDGRTHTLSHSHTQKRSNCEEGTANRRRGKTRAAAAAAVARRLENEPWGLDLSRRRPHARPGNKELVPFLQPTRNQCAPVPRSLCFGLRTI